MAITRAGTKAGAVTSGATTLNVSSNGNVTSGNLVSVAGQGYRSGTLSAFTAGSLTKYSGTSTIGTKTLDRGHSSSDDVVQEGIWSFPVTGTGSLTVRLTISGSGDIGLVIMEYVSADTTASRVADGNDAGGTGSGTHGTGNITSGGPGVFVGIMVGDNDGSMNPDAAFSTVYQDTVYPPVPFNCCDRIVTADTTDSIDWTVPGNYWDADGVVYKEATAATTGSGSTTLDPSAAATGVVGGIGAGAATLAPAVAASGTAVQTFSGAASVDLAPTTAATGVETFAGTAAITVGPSVAATGLAGAVGTADLSLSPTIAATAVETFTGSASVALALTVAATAAETLTGTAAVSLAPTVAAAGLAGVIGTAAASASFSLSGTGTASASAIAVLSGSVEPSALETDLVAGSETIVLTLSNETWIAA